MKTEDLIRYAALAVGVYLLYQWWQQQQAIAAPPERTTPAPGPPATTTTTTSTVNKAAQIKAAAERDYGPNPSLTADAWNFYAKPILAAGDLPAPEDFGFVGDGRNQVVQFDTYWTRLVGSKRVPGLGWLGAATAGASWGSGLSGWLT